MKSTTNTKLIKSLFSYTSATIVSQLLIALYSVLLIWWLDTEYYGRITAIYATVLLTSFVISLGLHEWLIRSIPLSENPKSLTGFVLAYKILSGTLWATGLMVLLPLINPEIYNRQLLLIIIFDVWLDSFFYLFLVDLLGNKKVHATSSLLITSKFLRVLSIVVIILMGSRSLFHIVLFRLIGTLIIFCVALLITKPLLIRMDKLDAIQILRTSFIFNTAETQNLIFQQLDLNLLTFINGDPTLIGDYSVVTSIFSMIMTIPLGIASLILPNLLETNKNSFSSFRKKMNYVYVGFIIMGFMFCASLWLLKLDIIYDLLNNGYQNIILLQLLASPGLFFKTANQANKIYLLTVKKERKQLFPQLIAIIIKTVLGIILIMHFKLNGMIWTSIISDVILFVGFTWQVIQIQGKRENEPSV